MPRFSYNMPPAPPTKPTKWVSDFFNNSALMIVIADILIWASLLALGWGLWIFLLNMPFWSVKEVDVLTPLKYAKASDLARVLPQTLKGNFLSMNLNQMRSDLLEMPWVKDIKIQRIFPNRLKIEIVEQTAVAEWGTHRVDEKAFVNEEGEIFYAPFDYAFPKNLPQFYGPEGTSAELLKNYIQFSQILLNMKQNIMQIYLSSRLSWEMRLQNGMLLKLGRSSEKIKPIDNLNRFVRFYSQFEKEFASNDASPKIIDLRYLRGLSWQ